MAGRYVVEAPPHAKATQAALDSGYFVANASTTNVLATELATACARQDALAGGADEGSRPPTALNVWLLVRDASAGLAVVGAAFYSDAAAALAGGRPGGSRPPPYLCPMPPDAARALADAVFGSAPSAGDADGTDLARASNRDDSATALRRFAGGVHAFGVAGAAAAATDFARRCCEIGAVLPAFRVETSLTLYQMSSPALLQAPACAGKPRTPPPQRREGDGDADRDDEVLDWIARCMRGFHDELQRPGESPSHSAFKTSFGPRLSGGLITVWLDDTGAPVSLAGFRPAAGPAAISRVGPVYTPPEQRRKRYAAATVANCTRMAFECGARSVILYADTNDLGANELYTKVGFQVVDGGNAVELQFV
ncbi:hypothetical protein HK405_002058 [Cladochytrium tenue]|nr:hypothetical protein HK405_002058 [Cladochytrium tenue]